MGNAWFKRALVVAAATTACVVSIGGPVAVVAASPDATGSPGTATDSPGANSGTPGATTGPAGTHQWHGSRQYGGDPLLAAVWKLNLTAEQQAGIRKLVESARQARRAEAQAVAGASSGALANPGDPNYGAEVAAAKSRAAERIQARSELNGQIYALLTSDQQAQLPQLLSDMQSKQHAHHGRS